MGKPMPRVDIPAKVTGGAAYVQDLRLPGMVHARVVRPPSHGARLTERRHRRGRGDAGRGQGRARRQLPRRRRRARVPGGQGDARAGAAPRSGTRRRACRDQADAATTTLQRCRREDGVVVEDGATDTPAGAHRSRRPITGPTRCTARSARPAPSALLEDGALTVWTHTQGVYPDCASAIAEMLGMPRERCAASTWRAPAATATTAPTTPPPTRR